MQQWVQLPIKFISAPILSTLPVRQEPFHFITLVLRLRPGVCMNSFHKLHFRYRLHRLVCLRPVEDYETWKWLNCEIILQSVLTRCKTARPMLCLGPKVMFLPSVCLCVSKIAENFMNFCKACSLGQEAFDWILGWSRFRFRNFFTSLNISKRRITSRCILIRTCNR